MNTVVCVSVVCHVASTHHQHTTNSRRQTTTATAHFPHSASTAHHRHAPSTEPREADSTMSSANLDRIHPSRITVLLMEKISQDAVKTFEAEGYTVKQAVKYGEDDLIEAMKGVHIIGVRSKTKLTSRVLEAADKLVAVGCFCIGTDQTDLKLAATKGIPVFNAPYANTRSVSELVIANIITLARQASDRNKEMHAGEWNKRSVGCYEVRGKTLGVVGYGHVGSQLSVLAEAMGMRVIFYDIEPKLCLGNASQVPTMEELLEVSDFVSLHVPADESTKNLMNAERIAQMKAGSYLINYARGSVVDIEAAAAALRSGHLAGAAFDVFPSEPAGHTKDWAVCLQGCPNTILTPHIGGSTEEAQASIGREVASKLIAYINHGSTLSAVNVPEVNVTRKLQPGQSRVLSFHINTPGVLRDINRILSIANISSQQLETSERIGYLVVDLEADHIEQVKSELEALDSNVRCRILFRGKGYVGPEP
ncbi:D-3-phosphoglycerate dehydrogenase [Salpingoeca rosetta]|uniref:2-oxoglutarate reductase n=1 Tax=Salpingoeca rosetta (strain ATCC 50818 / BSB-021) TaxID=946362 RepID=F2UBE4_SALR5|nr:D-3-phosphoglycerate dehydrogenase [Salpingoeca rosetta]EGD73810.1 D-3-phosphoglycerate dehydrogenase [Salpingoeca rosetta]|eukprot:XP_004993373.1 D-3-phosphoglycerate dehydrogenase [Salpingoeca rosetta]